MQNKPWGCARLKIERFSLQSIRKKKDLEAKKTDISDKKVPNSVTHN